MDDYKQLLFNHTSDSMHRGLMKEFGLSEIDVLNGVKHLMDWYKAQEHFPKYLLDESFIETLYSLNKYSIERSKKKLDILLTVRSVIPEFFDNRDPHREDYITTIDHVEPFIIPQLLPDNSRVVFLRYTEKDTQSYNPEVGLRHLFMMSDMRMFWDISSSDHYVWDFTHLKLGHISKYTPALIKKASFVIQEAYSARIKGVHFVNSPPYAQTFFSIIKKIFKKKIVERIHFHKSLDDLHKIIPKEYLPREFGGTNLPQKELKENLQKVMTTEYWKKWYMESCTQKVDETKRPMQTQSFDEILGFSGNFRKLEVD